MIHVNEWDAVPWKGPPVREAHEPVDAIVAALESLQDDKPRAVHFYKGEGLRWIRVAFPEKTLRRPADVARIAGVIGPAIWQSEDSTLYFQALRPYDLLFFLEGGDPDSMGMGTGHFGVAVDEVLKAWSPAAP